MGSGREGKVGDGVLRRVPVGMSTGCYMETNLTINFILKNIYTFEKPNNNKKET